MNEERLHELEREILRRKAVQSFPHFLDYTDPNYSRQWFHTLIAEKCQDLLLGRLATDRLMVFVGPQHGKSEIVSRKFPAWALGWVGRRARTDGAGRGHERGLISEKRGADGLEGVQRIRFFNIDEALGTHCVDGGLIERIKVRGIASHVLLPSSFLLGALLRASRAPHSILPVRTSSQLTGSATALPWEA